MLTLHSNKLRSSQGHGLYIHCSTLPINASCKVSFKLVHWFWKKKIIEAFLTIYGHGHHLGHVTWIIYIQISSPFLQMLHMKFGFDWPSDFRGEDA